MKNLLLIAAMFSLNVLIFSVRGQAPVEVREPNFHFEIIGLHEPVEHTFRFKNKSKTELLITNVVTTSPLHFKKVTSKIKPGDEGSITVSLDMPRVYGDYEGEVRLGLKDAEPLTFSVTGRIIAPIQVQPVPAFFVATRRGYENAASIEITGNEKEALDITSIEHESERFTVSLRTLEKGRRFELTLNLKGEGKAGPVTEAITILTSSKKQPHLVIQAHTLIKDRIYTFPDRIDLGVVRLEELKNSPRLTEYLAQTLMVYRTDGTNLQVTARSPLPFVKISAEDSDLKDRSQVTIEVLPEKMKTGKIESTIALQTNDAEFSQVEIPFTATIEN